MASIQSKSENVLPGGQPTLRRGFLLALTEGGPEVRALEEIEKLNQIWVTHFVPVDQRG